ncbi:MAG: nickel-dependent lactate racemase [Anaerolineales bacterium]|nr:nickel-dependent lactate racemase [Anaerolineales bacterium]
MNVHLDYGSGSLSVSLPANAEITVVSPRQVPALPDPAAALREALEAPVGSAPLRERIKPGDTVGVVVNDITRATPTAQMLAALLPVLQDAVSEDHIRIFVALGTHRENTTTELRSMLGEAVMDCFDVIQNNCEDQTTQQYFGESSAGSPIWLNAEAAACDLLVLTGFIEPHIFAGFSGGGKPVMPGLAGLETIQSNHGFGRLNHPRATWGVTENNPVYDEIIEIASLLNTFLFNVTMNNDKAVTGVFAGDLRQAHAAGCWAARKAAMAPVPHPFDIVLTSNSGYPLDQNLYQSVKGMSAASRVVKPGGVILVAAECRDGIPDHGLYADMLRGAKKPAELMEQMRTLLNPLRDQWQVQLQLQVQMKADVGVYSDGLTPRQVRECLLWPVSDLEAELERLAEKAGPGARLCVLPQGPLTIPYLEER